MGSLQHQPSGAPGAPALVPPPAPGPAPLAPFEPLAPALLTPPAAPATETPTATMTPAAPARAATPTPPACATAAPACGVPAMAVPVSAIPHPSHLLLQLVHGQARLAQLVDTTAARIQGELQQATDDIVETLVSIECQLAESQAALAQMATTLERFMRLVAQLVPADLAPLAAGRRAPPLVQHRSRSVAPTLRRIPKRRRLSKP